MRLIDADALKEDILGLRDCDNGFSDTYDKACIIGVIDEQPTARPHWICELEDWNKWICSECGFSKRTDVHVKLGYKYCPNCGVRMER